MNVTASGTVTGGTLKMDENAVITMGASGALTLTGVTVDLSAKELQDGASGYKDGQNGGNGFAYTSGKVQLVNFAEGSAVTEGENVQYVHGVNHGRLLQDGDDKGYVTFDDTNYSAFFVNVAGQTEDLSYAINTAASHEETVLESVYLNAGTLNADVATKVASLHINETADKASGNVSLTGTAANFGTVSGKGTLNVDSATTLTADTLSIAAGETLTLTGSEHISFGAITSHGTLDIGADTLVTATGDITVNAGESLTTTGAGKLTGTSLTVYGDASLGADAEFSGDLNPNSGSLTIGGHTIVRGTMHGGDLVEGKEYKSAAILVESTGVLDVNNISANWGFSSFTVNGALNVTNELKLTTGNATYTVDGSGTITTKKLTLNNEGKYVFDGTNGLTLVVGEGGISAGSGGRTLTLANGLTVKASDDWTMNQDAKLNGTVNLNTQGNDLTISSVLSNAANTTGGLAISGGGTVVLNGGNSFSGGLTVTGATVEMGNNNALGNANNAITIGQGGVIDLKGHDNVTYAYTLAGGTLQNTGNATGAGMKQTMGLTLTENSTIGGTGDFQIIASGHAATTINLGSNTLAKTGDNTVHFVNSTITEGTVQVDAGALDFRTDQGSNTVRADIVLNGGGTALTGGFKYADSTEAVIRNLTAKQDVTVDAAIEIGNNVTMATSVDNGKTLTMTGAITGTGNFSLSGTGTLALGSSINTTGDVTVAAGAAITFANGASITANSFGLGTGSKLDFSDYKGAIGSEIHVVTTASGVTGYTGAVITGPTAPRGMTATVAQEENDIVLTFQAKEDATMHLYILTGQSNSLGAVKGKPMSAEMIAAYQSEALLWNGNMHKNRPSGADTNRYIADPTWQVVAPQEPGLTLDASAYSGNPCMGPEYGFSYIMQNKGWTELLGADDTLAVVKGSLDGGGNGYWLQDNNAYQTLLDNVKLSIQDAVTMGYKNIQLEGLMYLQGESNSAAETAVADTRFADFLSYLTVDLNTWLATEEAPEGVTVTFADNAVTGENFSNATTSQKFLDAATKDGKVNADDNGRGFVFTKDLANIGDDLHYRGTSQLTIGARYAYAFAVQKGINVGAVRGQDYSKTLDQAGAWWMEKLPGENEVATWDISSVSTVNEIAAGKTLTVGGIEIQEVYYDEATAKGQGSVAINGGTISLGQHGINLVGGDLAITSAVSARATQTWQAANGHKLVVNGTTIGDGATLKLADDLYLTFGYITGTGSLEIGTVTFDMDLDYMGTMGKASYISSEGEGANGYVNEVNLIDLSAGDGTISFTHGGGVENITQAGDLAGCTLTLGGDSKTLKVTMPSTAPDTVYFTRSGEVTYTSTDAGENGIYNATELVLSGQQGSPATLTLQSNLQDGVGIKAVGLGGTVKIDSNVVLNASSLETDGAPVTIAGSGVLVGRSSGSVDSLAPADVFGPGVTLSTDWTGTVKIADSTIPGGNIGIKLNELGNENSVVEFENVKAFLNTSSYTYTPNIKFTGAGLNLDAGASGQTFTFSGDVTGDGTFHPSFSRGSDNQTFVFAGDVEGWNGQVLVDTNKTVTVKFSDEADTVNAAIKRTGGTLNLYASTDTTFNGAISGLSSFVVDANKSASVLGGIGTNATTLNAGSSLTIGGTGTTNTLGTVTVGGANANLTFGADVTSVAVSNLTLNDNASLTLTNNKAGATLGLVTLNSATLTVQGSEAATATRMTVGDQKAPTLVLGQNLSVGQLDTMGALNTFTIKSAEGGEAKTLTAGTLDLANQETKIALQNVTLTVTGAATVGEVVERTTNNDTMLVGSGATLNLNGGVNWNHNGKYVDLVIENGGAVNVTNGTENTLRGVNLGAGSSLTFGTGTSTTIGGAVVLANTITNDGSVTLTGTVNLDALTALHENEGYWEGEEDTGNGFYYNSSTVRVFAEDHVGEVVSTGATITYKGVGGTLDDATGIFEANGEKDLTTFHAMKDGSWSSLGNAITKGETHLTTMKMHAGTGLTADVTTAVENLSIDADSATKAAHVAGGTANFTNLIGEGKVDVDSEAVLNATNITVESGKSLAIGGAGALGITNINGAGTVNVDAATVTGGNVAINGGGTVNFGDGETISFTGLNVSGNGTNVTFDSLVTVTGNVRTSIGFENPATEGTTVTFNAGYVYTGNNGYALLAGNNDTIKLGGTTNLSNKTVGLNATGKLVVLEDAVVAVGRMYNTSAGTSNGTVEVQQRGTLTIGSVGVSTITNLSNAGKVTVNRTTTVASAFSNTGSISVVGASASSMTTLNVNNGDATLDMGAISLNNAELHIGSGAESRVRNISTLTVDGAGRLTQNSWNNLMHITALNNGTGEGERSFTWQMNTNHYTNSVLYLDGEGNFNGTFTASRGNGSGNGAYQGHLQVNHQKALQNAVLEVNGYNASNYMSVALNADKVETRGVTGNANSIIYAGEADTSVNKGAGRTAPVSTREGGATLAMNVADETTHEFAGKVESGISLEKSGAGTQVFSGDMSNFNGSVDVQAGELNIMNIAQDTSLNVKDVTIAAGATMGVYNGATATPETASEGTLTMKAGNTLKAGGNNATLNANLVMEAGSVLEVSLAQATHGLTMGSTVELNMGDLLGTEDLGFVQNLKFGEYYYLYNDVESLSVNGTQYDSLNFKDWTDFDMDASTVYTQLDEKRYALVYSWNGENVGRVAITLLPEPTTGTLSLLALCALAARRRRK
ncbi:MAG: sialate O-acetylesterase [Akkermansia sp.]|nr:sialate O-acetylesterase [Akkermansia sp.]